MLEYVTFDEYQEFLEICEELDRFAGDYHGFVEIYKPLFGKINDNLNYFISSMLEIKKNQAKIFLYYRDPLFVHRPPRNIFLKTYMRYLACQPKKK